LARVLKMFVDRVEELAFLDGTLRFEARAPGSLVLVYGRRRVGKTVLLRHWAERSRTPYTYWAAEKESAALQRRSLFAQILNTSPDDGPQFESWTSLWRAILGVFNQAPAQPRILILDELPYAADADKSMLSTLQHAWDQHFQHMKISIVLCGSHVRAMETLLTRGSPLFGRMTGQWHLLPMTFGTLKAFFPKWTAEERVAAYAVAGGIPAYLSWLDPARSLVDNIREVVLAKSSMFVSEPAFLLYDEVREPMSYLSVLKAIGAGHHSLDEISNACLIGKTHLTFYLARLQELRMVERRLPATVHPSARGRSRMGRYHLSDSYFRFYFRFVAPHQTTLAFDPTPVLNAVRQGLRAFVGKTVFEELAREWVRTAAKRGVLSWYPDMVGSYWSRQSEVDVVAVNWQQRQILLGECKWTADSIDRAITRELTDEKTPAALAALPNAGAGWTVTHALFARSGFTAAARRALTEGPVGGFGGHLVDLGRMDKELE
jgi:uncharacterized protein